MDKLLVDSTQVVHYLRKWVGGVPKDHLLIKMVDKWNVEMRSHISIDPTRAGSWRGFSGLRIVSEQIWLLAASPIQQVWPYGGAATALRLALNKLSISSKTSKKARHLLKSSYVPRWMESLSPHSWNGELRKARITQILFFCLWWTFLLCSVGPTWSCGSRGCYLGNGCCLGLPQMEKVNIEMRSPILGLFPLLITHWITV